MKILISYGIRTTLTKDEINKVITLSREYGEVKIEKWDGRLGAIDLVTTLEIFLLSYVSKPILDGFFKGLFDEEYFKQLGKSTREELLKEVDDFKSYLTNLYHVFVSKKLDDHYAVAVVEHIEGVVFYAVLNHKKSTKKLIERLPVALVRAVGEISLKRIPLTSPHTVQLYPNFETETWDYLFIPTIDGFGNFIDRYYDFKLQTTINLNSREEFYVKFDLDDDDVYKYIISAKHHEEGH